MLIDLHNHTKFCNHAEDEMEQYVLQAIKKGIKIFGFSDHAPMDFDEKYRMSFEQMSLYRENFLELQERYKNQIELLFAYEVDYLVGHMDKRVLEADVDYLIGSVHFLNGWGFDNPEFIGKYSDVDIDELWSRYFVAIEEMAKSSLFEVVAHLDLLKVFKFLPQKNSIVSLAQDALKAIKQSEMTLELNMSGLRKPIGEIYPSLDLLKEAKKVGIEITFSSDAHKASQVGMFSKEVVDLACSVGYSRCVYYKNKKREFLNF